MEGGHRPVGIANEVLEHREESHLIVLHLVLVEPLHVEDLRPVAGGHLIFVLDQKAVLRDRVLGIAYLDVGDMRRPHLEALFREEVVDPVQQVFLDHVLLVLVALLVAVRDQLDLVLSVEDGTRRGLAREIEEEWREIAGASLEAEHAPGLHLEFQRAAGVARCSQHDPPGPVLAVLAPVLLELLEIGNEGEVEKLLRAEEGCSFDAPDGIACATLLCLGDGDAGDCNAARRQPGQSS